MIDRCVARGKFDRIGDFMKEKYKPGEHLLDYLSRASGSAYLSDLRQLTAADSIRLESIIRELSVEMVEQQEWNDTLYYLTREGPEKSADRARSKLLKWLHQRGTML